MLSDVLFKGSGSFQGRVEPTTRREAGGWGWIRAKNHCDGSQASPFLAKARTKSARWLALVIRVSCGHSFGLIVSVVVPTEAGLYQGSRESVKGELLLNQLSNYQAVPKGISQKNMTELFSTRVSMAWDISQPSPSLPFGQATQPLECFGVVQRCPKYLFEKAKQLLYAKFWKQQVSTQLSMMPSL